MKRLLLISALGLMVAITPAVAQSQKDDGAGQMAIEGMGKLMDALGAFIKSIPQYEAPEVLPNGDIIIRRKHPGDKDARPAPKLEETRT